MRRETPIAGPLVIKAFKDRELKALQMILDSGIEFIELGIFGSYARNEYTAISDIDILAIVNEHPPRHVSGNLREDLDTIGVDLIYATQNYFDNSDSLFARKVREDYIERLKYGEKLLWNCLK